MDLTELPQPNIPLLRKAVEWAEAEAAKPERERQWDQGEYVQDTACGTAYCVAGWAVVNAHPGKVEVFVGSGLLEVDGVSVLWHDTGRDLLGLTDDEAERLFYDRNTIETVRAVAEEIAARVGERL